MAKIAAAREIRANLPRSQPIKTFSIFEERKGTEQALRAALGFCDPGSPVRLLTLAGPRGSGKSHLLEAVARNYLERGLSVRYEVAGDLLNNLRATFNPESTAVYKELWDGYANVPLLLLDELGMEHNTPWAMEQVSLLVGKRERDDQPTMCATNLTRTRMARFVDEGVADRLWNLSRPSTLLVALTATSYRTGESW